MSTSRLRISAFPPLCLCAVLGLAAHPLLAAVQNTAFCPTSGTGDLLTHGIYVPSYSGHNVRQVELAYLTDTNGTYTISLTLNRGAFNGPEVGITRTAVIHLDTSGATFVVFDFGGTPITKGDTLTLTHQVSGPGSAFYDTGPCGFGACSSCPGIFETEDTAPPLSTLRRRSVAVSIEEDVVTTACVPSDTVMCIDDLPGDKRFQISGTYATSQGGSLSGSLQEIPLAPLGVSQGGMFWFFGPTNPELLIKVINACALNNKHWVFFSAGTNVGFTVTVTDTATGHQKVYNNPDNHAALPLQDTAAFDCP